MTGACLDDEALLDVAEGRRALDPYTEAHLGGCDLCRRVFAAAARGGGGTLRGVETDLGDEPSWEELGQGVVVARRYLLERFLGAGSMGIVWAARDTATDGDGDRVALKVARSADPELRRRFEREARVASALDHPNVVRTLDILPAAASRGPCLVMELLEGEPLEARLLRVGALDVREGARVGVAIAAALAAAHAQGIVHRDLKPQNVMLAGARVVVLDFGIAKLLPAWGAHTKLTATGAVVGTPRFMAPEQIFGEPDVDARADVWALGALLLRVLSGRAPVEGSTIGEVTKALRHGTVPDPAVLAPALPEDVLALLRSALVVPREKRLADVRRFVDVLAQFT
jgi:serine/threonine-protein kinase